MTDQPTRSPPDDRSFFGPAPERLQAIADEAERCFEQASVTYGDALIALGNAHAIHASPAMEARSAFEKALVIYSLTAPDSERIADAHHRLASVLRRLGEHGQAAEHLAKAIGIWEKKGLAEEQFLQTWRQELKQLRTIHLKSRERTFPPG